MMKALKLITIVLIVVGVIGCSSSGEVKPRVKTSEQFQIDEFVLTVSQRVTPEIAYHTESEIQALVKNKVTKLLKDKGLLTSQAGVNTLKINAVYKRKFVGGETPFPTDSLAYPQYDYEIKVLDGVKELTVITRKDLAFKGGFMMNLKIIAGSLREKSDEIIFIDTFAEEIVAAIQEL